MPHRHRGGRPKRSIGHHAFTLIEVLIVIAIIAILFAVLIPNLFNARNAAQESALQAHSRTVQTTVAAWTANDDARTSVLAAATWDPCVAPQSEDGFSHGGAPAGTTTCSVDVGAAEAIVVTVSGTVRGEVVTYVNGVRQ